MKKPFWILAAAALAGGCSSEAERFGYKGADLEDDEMMYFTIGAGVTNWVPTRVLNVYENYEMSEAEKALVAAAGVVVPSEPLKTVPAGYGESAREPWFTTYTRDGSNLGLKGVNGFIAHFNEDKKVWETGETWFSSYWDDRDSALAALAALRKTIGEKFSPKKIYSFENCFVAEYLRLRVMCVVGLKGDGKWSCMLNIQDKNRTGCGQWEPVEMQLQRVAEYKYRKAVIAWKADKAKVLAENDSAAAKIREAKGYPAIDATFRTMEAGDGRRVFIRGGMFEVGEGFKADDIWKEKLAALEQVSGVGFTVAATEQTMPDGFVIRSVSASNELYEARLDMACPPPAAEKKQAADGTEEAAAPAPTPSGEWREMLVLKLLDGRVLPARPAPPQR